MILCLAVTVLKASKMSGLSVPLRQVLQAQSKKEKEKFLFKRKNKDCLRELRTNICVGTVLSPKAPRQEYRGRGENALGSRQQLSSPAALPACPLL